MLLLRYVFIILLACSNFLSLDCIAQGEILANVMIDYSQLQPTQQDKDIIEEAKLSITNFINNRKWTNDNFAPEERIRCNISINITSIAGLGSFIGTAQIQSSRPVYGTSYETTLLNFFDRDFAFSYQQGQPMDFNENVYLNEITTLMGFYVYVILGMDYDSFSKLGGQPYFDKVLNIVNNIPAQSGGWANSGNQNTNNRAALSENLQSQQLIPVREGLYTYHRLILDDYLNQKKPEDNHKKIIELLKAVQQFDKVKRPYNVAVRSFFMAKGTELMNLLSQASPEIKKQAIEICSELDPTNAQKYQRLMTMN
ncbi:MAG: DUF4835 family protein [Cytophagales bacterium]|nr:MAG: DUF4835 family protein [Cytophagales bacterium]